MPPPRHARGEASGLRATRWPCSRPDRDRNTRNLVLCTDHSEQTVDVAGAERSIVESRRACRPLARSSGNTSTRRVRGREGRGIRSGGHMLLGRQQSARTDRRGRGQEQRSKQTDHDK